MGKTRVAVLGATGYSGAEAVRILLRHPRVDIAAVTAEQYVGQRLDAVHPFLRGCDAVLEAAEPDRLLGRVDVAIGALPEEVSAECLPALVAGGVRVVDISAAFRIKDGELHRRWYGADPAPELRREAVYGLTELRRSEIRDARLVANPGCYPTGALLPLVPVLRDGLVQGPLVVDAKSGVSGARRKAAIEQLFCEVNESVRAYAIANHRHGAEMEQELQASVGRPQPLVFAPHVVPISRGILSTIYARAVPGVTSEAIEGSLAKTFAAEPFVVLCRDRWPEIRETRGTNRCAIGWGVDARTGTVVLVSALDNLGKGAAGQAVQNLNLMCGFPETEALLEGAWGP